MVKPIPDRWLDYSPIGQKVAGTRFIAFKVPLRQHVNETVEEKDLRLAPESLLESVPNLGLIIDLTNTKRYYNPSSFIANNVSYQKLMIPGKQTPPRHLAERFCQYVDEFQEANADNDKLIGVHCTHGVNRTGYLICFFMITRLHLQPHMAILHFSEARGHEIERQNYTFSLNKLGDDDGSCSGYGYQEGNQYEDRSGRREVSNWRVRSRSPHRNHHSQDRYHHSHDRNYHSRDRYQDRHSNSIDSRHFEPQNRRTNNYQTDRLHHQQGPNRGWHRQSDDQHNGYNSSSWRRRPDQEQDYNYRSNSYSSSYRLNTHLNFS